MRAFGQNTITGALAGTAPGDSRPGDPCPNPRDDARPDRGRIKSQMPLAARGVLWRSGYLRRLAT